MAASERSWNVIVTVLHYRFSATAAVLYGDESAPMTDHLNCIPTEPTAPPFFFFI